MSVNQQDTRIAVAIVNWNTQDLLRACLQSVLLERPDEIVVIDNGSSDGSVEMMRRQYPDVPLVIDPANPGYGAASNAAVRYCTAPYVLILNSDTVLRPGALRALAEYLGRHPQAAIVGPRLLNLDGTLQRSCFPFPSPVVPLVKRQPLAKLLEQIPRLQERYVGAFAHDCARRVPWVIGAAFAVRRTAFERVGGFDESFVMYFEEVDLCYRLQQAGWEVHFAPVAEVVHVGGASTRQRRAEMLLRLSLSSVAFYRRHYTGLSLALALVLVRVTVTGRLLRDRVRCSLTPPGRRREELAEDVGVWQRLLRGAE